MPLGVGCLGLIQSNTPFQVQDILFAPDGSTFFSSSDLVSRDSADRNLMAWDFKTGVTLSNQIYQVIRLCLPQKLKHIIFLRHLHVLGVNTPSS